MRFDDSLDTVLSADMSSAFGVQSAWRQLVDLIGRRRVPADARALDQLATMRADVPPPVRAASARGLTAADPPAALVRLFAADDPSIAAPVLRSARLDAEDWIAMLPSLAPATRSVLRHRRDLPADVCRALESFGSVDFVLSCSEAPPVTIPEPLATPDPVIQAEPIAHPATPADPVTSFVSIASVARTLPVVLEALRNAQGGAFDTGSTDAAVESSPGGTSGETSNDGAGVFEIADIVARIDAYQRHRTEAPATSVDAGDDIQTELFEPGGAPAQSFRFETDAGGVVRWIEGAARAPLIGLSLELAAVPSGSRIDGVAAGAFRRRAGFANARLVVDGTSNAGGQWRITGIPVFDRHTGRFMGYRGAARRPRADEIAERPPGDRGPSADALRQLVHELRTPTNAIAGFAEMIEREILGPVPAVYRGQAAVIRSQVADLLTAIDDIDMAARIEARALDLRVGDVALAPLLARVADDLAPLARLRGTELAIAADGDFRIAGDDRAVERLIGRLMATLVASGGAGESLGVAVSNDGGSSISLVVDRPAALADYAGDGLLTIDAESEAERDGAPLLGTGFALRLARNLAVELGGSLEIGDRALTLRLPAAVIPIVEQVSSS